MKRLNLYHTAELIRTDHVLVFLRWIILVVMMGLFACGRFKEPKTYFPETGQNALYQRALDLKHNLSVLSIALRPGYEDLSALAYLRFGKGAQIMNVYVTNGEAMDSDTKSEYPTYRAGTLREEAYRAISLLDGQARFLNMPDIAAARDTHKVRSVWSGDSLRQRLENVLIQFKPDVILLARDWRAGGKSPCWDVLHSDLLRAIKRIIPEGTARLRLDAAYTQSWEVDRVFIDEGDGRGISIPVDDKHSRWKRAYRELGQEAAEEYASLAIQKSLWRRHTEPKYKQVYSEGQDVLKEIDEGLGSCHSENLSAIQGRIDELTDEVMRGKTDDALEKLVSVMESVNLDLTRRYKFTIKEKRALYQWKWELEKLRCSLQGIEVEYDISDKILTERQLAFLMIKKVKGWKASEGRTDIYFPGVNVEQGWAVNEDLKKKWTLTLGEAYRILTPLKVEYSLPPGQFREASITYGTPFDFYIIHQASSETQSFVYNQRINILFAPRFITEVLTPVVRLIPGEKVAVRLMNISKDDVQDTLKIEDELASSSEVPFIFDTKEEWLQDTLHLSWRSDPKEGSYIVPLRIYDTDVANIVARKFNAEIDPSKKVGVIMGLEDSPIESTLERMNVQFMNVDVNAALSRQIEKVDVLIVDQRVLSLKPDIISQAKALSDFVHRGGHLIILTQDADTWNERPLWEGISLESNVLLDENTSVVMDDMAPLFSSPNRITSTDWSGWLFLRAYNGVSAGDIENVQVPLRTENQSLPLIVVSESGSGQMTYVDLALAPQWLNIHPGSFKLLANLISN